MLAFNMRCLREEIIIYKIIGFENYYSFPRGSLNLTSFGLSGGDVGKTLGVQFS